MRRIGHRPDGSRRAQTLPDFTVAVAIFLATVAFILLFIPQIIQPFADQEQPVVAERIGSDLSNNELVENETTRELNETATIEFFEKTEREVLETMLDDTTYSLNITIRDGPSKEPGTVILCADDSDGEWIGSDCTEAEQFAIGQPIPTDSQSVATTRLTVFAGDRDVVIEVGVW